MSHIRCVVIDDEPLALQLLSDYVIRTPGLELISSFCKPLEAIHPIHKGQVDLIFLDIQMPEVSGFQFINLLHAKHKIILTTAYPEYALEGFEYDVVDYLLKPISYERFLVAVQKASPRPDSTISHLAEDYIFVKTEHKLRKIQLEDIIFIEALRDYVAIHTVNKQKILSLQPMRVFDENLPNPLFIRIHKSYIVAINKIEYIEKSQIFIDGKFLPIGDTYKDSLSKRIRTI